MQINEKSIEYFSKQASSYFAYRPNYPQRLFEFLATLCSEKDIAWDSATGNGQAAVVLADFFKKIIATDSSEEQLKTAPKKNNILYKVSLSENTDIAAQSVDFICVAQALHWFNLEKFYKEVHRVAKPNSVIAAWSYSNSIVSNPVDQVIGDLYQSIVSKDVITIQRKYVFEKYQTIPFPFKRILTPTFNICEQWSLQHFVGYLKTWPGVKDYSIRHNKDIVTEIYPSLVSAWGNVQTPKKIRWPLYLLVGRID